MIAASNTKSSISSRNCNTVVRSLLLHILKAYQMVISPFLGQNCRYYPSCSEYMIGCITKHGALKGSWFGTKRILRCHPLFPGGHDPIP